MSLNTLGTKQTSVVNVGIKESHKKNSREDYINIILSKAKKDRLVECRVNIASYSLTRNYSTSASRLEVLLT
jgi:hypothetical protein